MSDNVVNHYGMFSPYEVIGFAFSKSSQEGFFDASIKTALNTRRIYHQNSDSQHDAVVINLIVLFKGVEFYHEHHDNPHLCRSLAQDLGWLDVEAEVVENMATTYMAARRRWQESDAPYFPYRMSVWEKILKIIVNRCNKLASQQVEARPYTDGRKAQFAQLRETFTNALKAKKREFIRTKLVPNQHRPDGGELNTPSQAASRAGSVDGVNTEASQVVSTAQKNVVNASIKENEQDSGTSEPVQPATPDQATPAGAQFMSQPREHEPSSPTANPMFTPDAVSLIPAAQNHPVEAPPVQIDAHEDHVHLESPPAGPPPEYGAAINHLAAQGNNADVLSDFINMAKNVVQHPDLSDFAKTEILACIARLDAGNATVDDELAAQ